MSKSKSMVLGAAVALFATWGISNLDRISADDEWLIRFILGSLFSFLIIVRAKKDPKSTPVVIGNGRKLVSSPIIAVLGLVLSVGGIIFNVNQFEWLGLVLLLCACLSWALPLSYRRDVLIGIFILYWIHPLPGQIFGKLELLMQWLSVQGAERVLHCMNERVWADGLILHTGLRFFGVPEACSGMRTAVTVILCVLGTGLLMRIRWFYVLGLMVLGLVQVMVLNIIRVSFMVAWADNMPEGWGETFLHDSLGAFLIVAILLMQIEVALCRRVIVKRKAKLEGVEQGEVEPEDKASIFPAFWQFVFKWGLHVLAGITLLLGVAFFVFKQRPYHRAIMYYEVAEGLVETDARAAEKAINDALVLLPGNKMLLKRRIHVYIAREKPLKVLEEIEKSGFAGDLYMTAMKSWALMAVGKLDEAVKLVNTLPEEIQRWPRVAVIKAEHAAALDKPAEVRENMILASQDPTTLRRIRKLFLYLARHGMWDTIAQTDRHGAPHNDLTEALASVKASIKVNRYGDAGRVMTSALKAWPNEVRLLTSLFELAKGANGSKWEAQFAERLKANIMNLDVDRLAAYVDFSMQLKRPDLGWLAYSRLLELDPNDPMVYLAPAQRMDAWLSFRNHHLGVRGGEDETVNLDALYKLTFDMRPFESFWKRVPLAEILTSDQEKKVLREEYMMRCLEEMRIREKSGTLTRRMHESYPMILALAGNFGRAHEVQDKLSITYPDMENAGYLKKATFYSWESKWNEAYEAIRQYYAAEAYHGLDAELNLANILMNLGMGVSAMDVAERTTTAYPESVEARQMIGLTWNAYGFKEDALHEMKKVESSVNHRVMVRLLYDTGRYTAAERLSRVAGLEPMSSDGQKDRFEVLPAEASVVQIWPEPLNDSEMDNLAEELENSLPQISSEFIRAYNKLITEWYRGRGKADVSDHGKWLDIARDDHERVTVLSQLAIMLARQKAGKEALKAASGALEIMPRSAILQRLMISLSDGSADVIQSAREACPNDSGIWLASIVLRCRQRKDREALGAELEAEVKEIVESGTYSIGALTSAADYLLRKRYDGPAGILVDNIVKESDGYLPAFVLGMRNALQKKDTKTALRCALGGAENAIDAVPFYRMIVMIKSLAGEVDTDMISAINFIKERFPADKNWAAGLGYALFSVGDTAQSRVILADLLRQGDAREIDPGTLMLAAEAERHERGSVDAARILRNAQKSYPDNYKVLNNLIYNLAQDLDTIDEAKSLLPDLLKAAGEDYIAYDTAAMVYLKSGDSGKAGSYMEKALALLDEKSPAAKEIHLNYAQILLESGRFDEARTEISELMKVGGLSDMLNTRALAMQIEIKKREKAR